jgi:outer membrane protein TolC
MRRRLLPVLIAAALASCSLASCSVGPNFKTPEAPEVNGYLAQDLPEQTGADAQQYVAGMDIPGQWWTLFHSSALDELVKQSL